MLDQVNVKVGLTKEEWAQRKLEKKALALKLGECQRRVKSLGIPVMILFDGWDAAGKGTLINDLMIPLDPRSFTVYNCKRTVNDDEANRPFLWRYWMKTPPKGQMAILDSSYYSDLVHQPDLQGADYQLMLAEANEFEATLSASGTLIVKFFVHISGKEQRRRFKKLEAARPPAGGLRIQIGLKMHAIKHWQPDMIQPWKQRIATVLPGRLSRGRIRRMLA